MFPVSDWETHTPKVRQIRKRKRTLISCTECHRRKQKCNRHKPCSNCVGRGKEFLCNFENEYTIIKPLGPALDSSSRESSDFIGTFAPRSTTEQSAPVQTVVPFHEYGKLASDLGYSGLAATSKENSSNNENNNNRIVEINQQYRGLTRQLPPTKCIDVLLQTFFTDIAWQYDIIDKSKFEEQLHSWLQVPYSALCDQGPFGLPIDVRWLPALLFQVLAQALLFLPIYTSDEALESLKSAPGMTFHDLATEYCDAGHAISTLLGKREHTILRVQAGLLRTSFLKSSGCVIEAWHALGTTIRDAQEIGLDCESASSTSATTDHQWNLQMQRKLWLLLHLWDAHMAVVLGRPMSTNIRTDPAGPILPLDVIYTKEEGLILPVRRTQDDVPTPLSVILVGYDTAYKYLPVIHEMTTAKNILSQVKKEESIYRCVDSIHTEIVKNLLHLPDWCRANENTNPIFDSCSPWLPYARECLISEIHFVLLALHRPFVFSVANSRTEAIRAGLEILKSQARLFALSEPRQYMAFNLVFTTFDAMTLMASIYILYPDENLEYRDVSLQNIEWGMARLSTMGERNKMAKSAYQVMVALVARLRNRTFPVVLQGSAGADGQLDCFDEVNQSRGVSSHSVFTPYEDSLQEHRTSMATPLPPQPMHDLVFQNLSTMGSSTIPTPLPSSEIPFPSDLLASEFSFDDILADSGFWGYMNHLGN